MPVAEYRFKFKRLIIYFSTLVLLPVFLSLFVARPALATKTGQPRGMVYLPLLIRPNLSAPSQGISYVNQARTQAQVPPVVEDRALDNNCFEHARYMAENDQLTHSQDPNLPYATFAGQSCAERSNTWLGTRRLRPPWSPQDSVRGWLSSVPHRLWLLYPTMKMVGFGFYRSNESYRAAAAVDVLTGIDFGADKNYREWPIRYPGEYQQEVPAIPYPITLNWSYFGPKPILKEVQLRTLAGKNIAHITNTNLPGGHKGIQILPKDSLPANSTILVTTNGWYKGEKFSYSWRFTTRSATTWLGTGEVSDMTVAGPHTQLR